MVSHELGASTFGVRSIEEDEVVGLGKPVCWLSGSEASRFRPMCPEISDWSNPAMGKFHGPGSFVGVSINTACRVVGLENADAFQVLPDSPTRGCAGTSWSGLAVGATGVVGRGVALNW